MKDKTSVFKMSSVSVKVDGVVYTFEASVSLDLRSADFDAILHTHAEEYYFWRNLRDRVKKKLRSLRFEYEVVYSEDYFRHFSVAENSYNFVSNKVIEGLMTVSNNQDIAKLAHKIRLAEDKLDKLNSIVYALEHRKAMISLISNM